MLSDLKQFFSNFNEEYETPPIEKFHNSDNIAVSFLSHIVPLMIDDDIIADLITNIRDCSDEIEEDFYMLDTITIIDHWCDVLNTLCDRNTLNVVIKMVLLTIFDNEEFYFTNTTDSLFNYFDRDNERFLIRSGNQRMDKLATHWINDDSSHYFELNQIAECDDDLYQENYTRFILDCIHIKNKSKARKLRKAYSKNADIADLFDMLGYSMYHGQFVFLGWIDTQDYDPFYYSFSMNKMLIGIKELQKLFSVKVEHDTEELCDVLNNIKIQEGNYKLTNIINKINSIHSTSKEIIL